MTKIILVMMMALTMPALGAEVWRGRMPSAPKAPPPTTCDKFNLGKCSDAMGDCLRWYKQNPSPDKVLVCREQRLLCFVDCQRPGRADSWWR